MEYAHKNPNSHEIELHMCNVSKGSWKLIKRTASAHTEGDFGKTLQRVCKQALRTRQEMPQASKNPKKQEGWQGRKRIQAVPLHKYNTNLPTSHSLRKRKWHFFRTDSVGTKLTTARLALKCTRAHAHKDPSARYQWPLSSLYLLLQLPRRILNTGSQLPHFLLYKWSFSRATNPF